MPALHDVAAHPLELGEIPVVPRPGRQVAHALPVYGVSDDAGRVTCPASGFGWRMTGEGEGVRRRTGLAPIPYTPETLLHDLPANHPRHADCLIAVERRLED